MSRTIFLYRRLDGTGEIVALDSDVKVVGSSYGRVGGASAADVRSALSTAASGLQGVNRLR